MPGIEDQEIVGKEKIGEKLTTTSENKKQYFVNLRERVKTTHDERYTQGRESIRTVTDCNVLILITSSPGKGIQNNSAIECDDRNGARRRRVIFAPTIRVTERTCTSVANQSCTDDKYRSFVWRARQRLRGYQHRITRSRTNKGNPR